MLVHAAAEASNHCDRKPRDVLSFNWRVRDPKGWSAQPVCLEPLSQRDHCMLSASVYSYDDIPEDTLVVDFANANVGGGCFGYGFVQEEHMVVQSNDFTYRLGKNREHIDAKGAASYQGVHMDVW